MKTHSHSTTLSHTASCCCRYKPIWTVSSIIHNISHPPCCTLAQVVALSSRPFNVKLSVWLPSSCNAAPLIATATAQLKEVAFHQHITQYHILCCYRVNRPSLLNVQRPRDLFEVDKEIWQQCQTWTLMYWENRHLIFGRVLKIYKIVLLPQLPKRKHALVRVVQIAVRL